MGQELQLKWPHVKTGHPNHKSGGSHEAQKSLDSPGLLQKLLEKVLGQGLQSVGAVEWKVSTAVEDVENGPDELEYLSRC